MVTTRRSQDRPQSQRPTTRRTSYRQSPGTGSGGRSTVGPLVILVALVVLVLAAMPRLWPGEGGRDAGVAAAGAANAVDATQVTVPATGATGGVDATPRPTRRPTPVPTFDPLRTAPTPIPGAQRRLDNAFATMAQEVDAPGIAAAVKLRDGTVWYGATGVMWPDGPPVTVDTPFAWGSITKTLVAALVLRLVSEGRLDLDATLDTWIPDVPQARRITIRMLLGHTSGIFNYFLHPRFGERVYEDPLHEWTPQEILSLTGKRTNAPGRAFSYSNTNYVLLGLILEQATGRPLADQVQDELLTPLGLEQTVFQQAGRPVGLVGAKGFWKRKDGRGYQEWSDGTDFRPTTSAATVAWAAGAVMGSVRDLLDWEMALYEGDVLTPDALAQMLDFDPESGFGLGARTQTLSQRPGFGHGGSLRGFVSVMYRLPGEDLDVVVLANVGFANLDRVANRLASAALRALATPEPTIVADPTTEPPVDLPEAAP